MLRTGTNPIFGTDVDSEVHRVRCWFVILGPRYRRLLSVAAGILRFSQKEVIVFSLNAAEGIYLIA